MPWYSYSLPFRSKAVFDKDRFLHLSLTFVLLINNLNDTLVEWLHVFVIQCELIASWINPPYPDLILSQAL